MMRMLKPFVALAFVTIAAAPVRAQVSAEAVAKLEARRQSSPQNVGVLRSLGVDYFKLKRYSDAQKVLTEAHSLSPKDGVAALYLGMSDEELGDLTGAKAAYTSYLSVGRTAKARADVKQRLAAVAQKELGERAKALVAQEQQLSSQVGPTSTIAVMPFDVVSTDTSLRPLGRGLADLMITDLRKKRELTVLERDRIQALLDEIQRGQTNRVDQATAARSGRMLQAGRIVQGAVNVQGGQNLTIDANIVTVQSGAAASGGQSSGTLNQLFDVEKRTVLGIIAGMGYTLTAAEQNAIQQRPTQNVQAFLAYSRGLMASDAGRLDEAARDFDNARALDPGFGAAIQHANDARAAQQGQGVTTATIESRLRSGAEGQAVSAAEHGATAVANDALGTTLSNALADVNPSTADVVGRNTTTASTRDASTSTTSQDQPTTRTGTVTIVIKRP